LKEEIVLALQQSDILLLQLFLRFLHLGQRFLEFFQLFQFLLDLVLLAADAQQWLDLRVQTPPFPVAQRQPASYVALNNAQADSSQRTTTTTFLAKFK